MNTTDDEPVFLVPYDRSWPERFVAEQSLLLEAIGERLAGPIEHVSSTAVPGLEAKPVIDIMAGVQSLEASRPAIALLAALDYCYAPYKADVMHWFCKPSPAHRTHHLHLVPFGSGLWRERLAFRDYLRSHGDVAAEYAALKQRLAERHRLDRDAYSDAKGPFIARVVGLALKDSTVGPLPGAAEPPP